MISLQLWLLLSVLRCINDWMSNGNVQCTSRIASVTGLREILKKFVHRLKPGIKVNGTYYRDVVLRHMLFPDICSASGREFSIFFSRTVPFRTRDTVALLDQETSILSHPLTSTRLTTPCAVCFRSESVIPRSRMSTNWNDASTASGALWVARLVNVLLASGASIYPIAFVLKADILSTRCNKVDVTFWETLKQ